MILSLCLLLSACGFKLREPPHFAPELQTLYLQSTMPNDPFIQMIKHALSANGITVVGKPELAQSTLNIISINSNNNMNTSGGVNVAGFYSTYLLVTFEVTDQKGKILIPTTTLQQSQSFTSNATQVLSGPSATAQLISGMEQILVEELITELAKIPSPQQ